MYNGMDIEERDEEVCKLSFNDWELCDHDDS